MNQPYYYSWSAQNAAVDFPVEQTENDEFILAGGRRVYDMISTSFQANFGHSNKTIIDRVTQQMLRMPIASPKSTFELKTRVSNRLLKLVDRGPGKIFYTVSGAESVENGLKIARQLTGKKIVLARKKSYHGASLGALSVTGDWRNDPHWTLDEGTVRIPDFDDDPDLAKTRAMIESVGPDQIAAVILETISGTNGMSVPPASWMLGLQTLCRENGILLFMDEVLVGFGRCGPAFAFQDYGLEPDMVAMSKAISGGYIPFGALWTSEKIAAHYEADVLACGLTNYGHPLGLAAMEAVMDLLVDPEFMANKQALEQTLVEWTEALNQHPQVVETRCRGMMVAVYLNHPAPSWQNAFDKGLHLYSKNHLSILAPPYTSTPARLTKALAAFETLI